MLRGGGGSEAVPGAVRQAVGGGGKSGWGRLLSVTNAMEDGRVRLILVPPPSVKRSPPSPWGSWVFTFGGGGGSMQPSA